MTIFRIAVAVTLLGFGAGTGIVAAEQPPATPPSEPPSSTTSASVTPTSTMPASAAAPSVESERSGSSFEFQEVNQVIVSPYHTFFDPKYKVSGKVPDRWVLNGVNRWGTNETTLLFVDRNYPKTEGNIYYRMFPTPMQLAPDEIDRWLRSEAEAKVALRRTRDGRTDYANVGDMVSRTIGGRPALSWTATYTWKGKPLMEYFIRIYSPNCTLLLFLYGPIDDVRAIIGEFEPTLISATIP